MLRFCQRVRNGPVGHTATARWAESDHNRPSRPSSRVSLGWSRQMKRQERKCGKSSGKDAGPRFMGPATHSNICGACETHPVPNIHTKGMCWAYGIEWKSTSLHLLTCVSPCCPPLDPTYSTVQGQQTGFSTRFDDQHEFYVCIGDSPPKKSCRISLKHLKLDRCPICPRRRKPSHRPTSASLKLAIYLVIHRE